MDKQEYKIRYDEIKSLIKQREFQKAVEIADTIDWTRVRSVTTLCTISDLYKVNRRYAEAKVLLEQAYEKYPNGRMIVYSLCELCIRMGEIVLAIEYYKQYVSQWPTDKGKFILQYKIYETQDVSLEERIAVLEELKKRNYEEKWGYELANLYHRMGLATKCVEECDELIIWFREGPYVKKAMELKMLHQQLTDSQMNLYESMLPPGKRPNAVTQEITPEKPAEDDIMVKTMDMGQYNTINLQKELAESMKDVLVADNGFAPLVEPMVMKDQLTQELEVQEVVEQLEKPIDPQPDKPLTRTGAITQAIIAPMLQNTTQMNDTGELEELFFDDGNRSTAELKMDVMESLKAMETAEETAEDSKEEEEIPQTIDGDVKNEPTGEIPQYDPVRELELTMVYDPSLLPEGLAAEPENKEEESTEINAEAEPTRRIDIPPVVNADKAPKDVAATRVFTKEDLDILNNAKDAVIEHFPSEDIGDRNKEELMRIIDEKVQEALANALNSDRIYARTQSQMANHTVTAPISGLDRMLAQEYDGQISMVFPTAAPVEKQITGQLNIEDLLGEWENTKKHSQEKQVAETSYRVQERTGQLFTEFEAKARDSILEKLEAEDPSDSEKIDADEEYRKFVEQAEAEANGADKEAQPVTDTDSAPLNDEYEDEGVEEIEEVFESEGIPEDEENVADEISEESDLDNTESGDDTYSEEAYTEEEYESEEYEDEEDEEDADSEDEEDGTIDRSMTEDELALFGQFAQTKRARQKLLWALDRVSLAAYTGNIYVTGDTSEESLELAKNVVRYIQSTDHNFSGKIAKVTGVSLNNKSVAIMVEKLANGGLIIEKASGMSAETTKNLLKALNQEKTGIVVVMQDSKKQMRKMLEHFEGMKQIFNVHIEVEELSDEALVAYGRKYAEHLEYSIDDMGVLALHTRIDAMQTSDHVVTVSDVRAIVDEAISNANRKSFKHFTDVLLSKRYDDEDMIILREKDFME